jgi:hypothetical protein
MKTKGMIILAAVMLWLSPARAQQKQKMTPDQRAAKITEWMKTNLKLNDEQTAKVSDINKKYASKMEDLRSTITDKKKKMTAVKDLDKQKDSELQAVLTPDQFKSYLAKKEEMKEQVKSKMKEHKESTKSKTKS